MTADLETDLVRALTLLERASRAAGISRMQRDRDLHLVGARTLVRNARRDLTEAHGPTVAKGVDLVEKLLAAEEART